MLRNNMARLVGAVVVKVVGDVVVTLMPVDVVFSIGGVADVVICMSW